MRLTFNILLAILCLNLGFYMANQLAPMPNSEVIAITPTEINQTFAEKQPSVGAQPAGWIDTFISGATFLIDTLKGIILGFPEFLYNIGVPPIIYMPIYAIFMFIWGIFLYEIITGRDVTG